MKEMFFDPAELRAQFPGVEVTWNSMESDFDPRVEKFDESLLWLYFPNACGLELEWLGHLNGTPLGFEISLNQNPELEWDPFAQYECGAVEELRSLVYSCAAMAAARPSIPRSLSREWRLYSPFYDPPVDKLVLDPLKPLSDQTGALHAQLFIGYMPKGRWLVIGWERAYQFPGEFVIRQYQDDPNRWDVNENDPPELYPRTSWQLTDEWRCDNAAAIREIVESIYDQP